MTFLLSHDQFILYAIAGILGGLAAALVKDNCIELPKLKSGKLYLGTFGGLIISAIAGIIGDSNPVNAFVWGAVGVAFIERLIMKAPELICKKPEDIINEVFKDKDK